MNRMEILDPEAGHITLQWEPDNAESVKRARDEFDRLKRAGFAFFSVPDEKERKRLKAADGSYDVRPVMTRTFNARSTRTVARPPMKGG